MSGTQVKYGLYVLKYMYLFNNLIWEKAPSAQSNLFT